MPSHSLLSRSHSPSFSTSICYHHSQRDKFDSRMDFLLFSLLFCPALFPSSGFFHHLRAARATLSPTLESRNLGTKIKICKIKHCTYFRLGLLLKPSTPPDNQDKKYNPIYYIHFILMTAVLHCQLNRHRDLMRSTQFFQTTVRPDTHFICNKA